ncbi:hypothetical protein C0991_004528 [Blastosporella zonata]|nr:hypothetical protein C0991_004528 [Blastosporella zonata]
MDFTQARIIIKSIIHNMIEKEEQYVHALDVLEAAFIVPLRSASPPGIRSDLEGFIDDVFGGIMNIRECNRRLLKMVHLRQREEGSVVSAIGDIMFEAVFEFMSPYPEYIRRRYPIAEKRLKDELEHNFEFRLFVESASRLSSGYGGAPRFHLKHLRGHAIFTCQIAF